MSNSTKCNPMAMIDLKKSNNQDSDALDTVIVPLNSSTTTSVKDHESKSGISKLLYLLLILLLALILLFLIVAIIIAVYYSNAYHKCQVSKESYCDTSESCLAYEVDDGHFICNGVLMSS
ncbi:unnamed protein product [Heterobilharzia americana]|nr:unnamed protein product [Heterobilharzia americana]CAH8462136.1 unnamed protein product [Heterobilharzia americana]